MLPSVFLLAWYVWANDVSLINKPFALNGIVQFVTYKVYTAMKAGPYQDFIFNGVGDSQRLRPLYLLGILVNLFFLIALVMCCASVLWKEGAKEIARRAELVSSFIMMVIFLALPATLTGVVEPRREAVVSRPDSGGMRVIQGRQGRQPLGIFAGSNRDRWPAPLAGEHYSAALDARERCLRCGDRAARPQRGGGRTRALRPSADAI